MVSNGKGIDMMKILKVTVIVLVSPLLLLTHGFNWKRRGDVWPYYDTDTCEGRGQALLEWSRK